MKVELKADGTLYIQAETPIESFALGYWCHDYERQGVNGKASKVTDSTVHLFVKHKLEGDTNV